MRGRPRRAPGREHSRHRWSQRGTMCPLGCRTHPIDLESRSGGARGWAPGPGHPVLQTSGETVPRRSPSGPPKFLFFISRTPVRTKVQNTESMFGLGTGMTVTGWVPRRGWGGEGGWGGVGWGRVGWGGDGVGVGWGGGGCGKGVGWGGVGVGVGGLGWVWGRPGVGEVCVSRHPLRLEGSGLSSTAHPHWGSVRGTRSHKD